MRQVWRSMAGEVKRDRRKQVLLAVLPALGLLLWGRLLLKDVPRTATARPTAAGAVETAAPSGGPPPQTPVVYVELATGLGRDLFGGTPIRYDRTDFPQDPSGQTKSHRSVTDIPSRPAAFTGSPTLRLQSVLDGAKPGAVIDGVVLQPGQQIEGYTLIRVQGRRAFLEKHGEVLLLRM